MKERIKGYGEELLNVLRGPAAFDHPATWACIVAGGAIGAGVGIVLGALFK